MLGVWDGTQGTGAWLTGNESEVTRVGLVGAAPGELWGRAGLQRPDLARGSVLAPDFYLLT